MKLKSHNRKLQTACKLEKHVGPVCYLITLHMMLPQFCLANLM